MGTKQSYVIIGNGIAGITAAEILRDEDASCTITIVADDPFPAYYRPALKDYLGGCLPEEKLWARPSTFYQEKRIKFVPARVMGINTRNHAVQLHDGKSIGYSKLLLANGARPRTLSCLGLDLADVFTLRTVADYQQILRRLSDVKRVVICGSGTLALESAEALCHCGYQVTHLVRGKALWSEVLDPVASDMVIQEELRDGIDVRLQEEIAEIVGKNGRVSHVITKHGDKIACEMVLIAIGIEPLTDFIRASGILCGRGVKVDDGMCTNLPDIYAAGDVVEITDKFTGHTRVIGQWFPSIQQAQVAAYNMLDLFPPHAPLNPSSNSRGSLANLNYYNAAFLYGLDFVAVGLSTCPRSPDYQEIVADPMPRKYRKVVLKNGVIVGTLLLGERKQGLAFKRAIDHHVNIASIAHQIFADDFRFDAWLNEQGIPDPILSINDEGSRETSLSEQYMTISMPRLTSDKPTSDEFLIPNYILRALTDIPTLVLVSRNKPSRVLPLEYGQRYTLGRDNHCDIALDDPSSSRLHAEIYSASDGFYVRDLNSRYGVFVNKVKINEAHHLFHGDCIVVGNILIYFSYPQANALRQAASGPSKLTKQMSPSGLWREEVAITGRLERGVPVKTRGKEPIVVGLEHRREVQPLGEDQIKFEIDMCIGCNRCMEACPLPMSSQVKIADLNQSVVSERVNSHIARFADECIMCGSCVPVCPVNNHRDLLMLSLKQRIGISWDSKPNINLALARLPVGWTIAALISYLREQAILHDPQQVPDNYLLHIIGASKQRIFKPGEIVISEGEYGRDLYLILEGSLELTAADSNNVALPVAILRRGEYVGEDGMLTGYPYRASVRAKTPVLLVQVPEQVMQRLMELVPSVRNHFEQVNNVRSLKSILKRMALFQGVTDADIEVIMQQTLIRQYERDEQLFTEEKSKRPSRETLHIILEGFVKVARKTTVRMHSTENDERIIAYRQGGDYFAGGLDLLGDGRAVKVRTITRCRVAEVPRQILLALFQEYLQR